MTKKFIVVRTEAKVTTQLYDVAVEENPRGFPTPEDDAVSMASHAIPISTYIEINVAFKAMRKSGHL